jgi:hypothetical protein
MKVIVPTPAALALVAVWRRRPAEPLHASLEAARTRRFHFLSRGFPVVLNRRDAFN